MNKKIAIIIERADIALGGAERSVSEVAAALSTTGLDVNIIAAKGKRETKYVRILCKDIPGKRTSFFTFASTLKQYFAQNHYDIIHSVLPFDFADIYQPRGGSVTETILRNAASYPNAFLRLYKRVTAATNHRRELLLDAEKKLCKNPKGPVVAALSKYVERQFSQHYNLNSERIVVIPNGVKTDKRINPAAADKLRTQILAQPGISKSQEPILMLFLANNFRLKGLVPLIKAMSIAASDGRAKDCYLIIAGSGKSGKYRHLASRLGVEDRIVFLGPVRHIQNLFSIIDVAVLPTFYDPSSRFTLEAIAAGKPVITTSFNGATDLFEDGRHGKIIQSPNDTTALADAIIYFCDRDNIQSTSTAITDDNLKHKVSITRVAEQLTNLYERILEGKK
ncbi:MAG: glycosyltransferase family 4 protein [Planctomycetota bacterium]